MPRPEAPPRGPLAFCGTFPGTALTRGPAGVCRIQRPAPLCPAAKSHAATPCITHARRTPPSSRAADADADANTDVDADTAVDMDMDVDVDVGAEAGLNTGSKKAAAAAAALERAGGPRGKGEGPETGAMAHGMWLERRELERSTRRNRTFRARRWATLGELDASAEGKSTSRVAVALVARRAGRDYRVAGAAAGMLTRVCDRCGGEYEARARGRFEVWLVADGAEREEAEAVEAFGDGVLGVELAGHVRDAVLLGVPTKSLCKVGCRGVSGVDVRFGTVKYAGQVGEAVDMEAGELGRAMRARDGEEGSGDNA